MQIKNQTFKGCGANRRKACDDAVASALLAIANDFIALSTTSVSSNNTDHTEVVETKMESKLNEIDLIQEFLDNLCYGLNFIIKAQNSTVSTVFVVTEVQQFMCQFDSFKFKYFSLYLRFAAKNMKVVVMILSVHQLVPFQWH